MRALKLPISFMWLHQNIFLNRLSSLLLHFRISPDALKSSSSSTHNRLES